MKVFLLTIFLFISSYIFADWQDLNTGISDNLTGVVFYGNTGLLSGKKGLYVTTTGGNGPASWSRFTLTGTPDADIYNNTQFNHCLSNGSWSASNEVYACGKDTINNMAVIFKFNLTTLACDLVYGGDPGSSLNRVAYNPTGSSFYFVGDDGLFLRISNTGSIYPITTNLNYDLTGVHFSSTFYYISAHGAFISGNFSTSGSPNYSFNVTPEPGGNYNDVFKSGPGLFVGNKYSKYNGLSVTEIDNYDFGPLNASTIFFENNYLFIGTDHGIFRSPNSSDYFEYQPSSQLHNIKSFCWDASINTNVYACGNNGVLLFTTDHGGATKPISKITFDGGCIGSNLSITTVTGTSTDCEVLINDSLMFSRCDSLFYTFDSIGQYTIQLNVVNADSLRDTSIRVVNIVNTPLSNISTTVDQNILCHEEPIVITLATSQANVIYILKEQSSTEDFGISPPGTNAPLQFASVPINSNGTFYITAQSTIAQCSSTFSNTIQIQVEKTKADFTSGMINALPNEQIPFYQHCVTAQNYQWQFSPNASAASSTLANPLISFQSPGPTVVQLICSSNNGCQDTLTMDGPTIYAAPTPADSCWTLVNNGNDPAWSGHYYPDVAHLNPSTTGYLICGYYDRATFSSNLGSTLGYMDTLGAYVAKYTYDGVLKWMVRTKKAGSTRENINAVVEDASGNVYFCGNTSGYFFDTAGDSVRISPISIGDRGYIVKLNSKGKLIWKLDCGYIIPEKLTIDNSNNLIAVFEKKYAATNYQLYLNNVATGIISTNSSPVCNYFIGKFNSSGTLLWDFDVYINASDGEQITATTVDALNNVFVVGKYGTTASFYSVGGTMAQTLTGSGGQRLFLTKYNSSGIFQWKVRSITTGTTSDLTIPIAMKTDGSGNCYISGRNSSYGTASQRFDNANGTFTSKLTGNYFLAKVNTLGVCQWIQGATSSYYGFGEAVEKKGNEVSVIGQIMNNDETIPATALFTSANGNGINLTISAADYFHAIYDTLGNILKITTNGANPYPNIMPGYGFTGFFKHGDGSYYLARNIKYFDVANGYSNFGTILGAINNIDGSITRFYDDCGISHYPNSIGISQVDSNDKITLYPNPAEKSVSIIGLSPSDNNLILVTNALGEKVMEIQNTSKIELNDLSAGIYFVHIHQSNGITHIKKLIKN